MTYVSKNKRIMDAVCDLTGASPLHIKCNARHRQIVRVRWMCWMLARHLTDCTLQEIGKFYRRDHSTVIHGVEHGWNTYDRDPIFAGRINRLLRELGEPEEEIEELQTRKAPTITERASNPPSGPSLVAVTTPQLRGLY